MQGNWYAIWHRSVKLSRAVQACAHRLRNSYSQRFLGQITQILRGQFGRAIKHVGDLDVSHTL